MPLKDQVPLGMSIPHRSMQPITTPVVRSVVRRAEEMGFGNLWVTSNTLDHASCMDSITLLSYAAALTEHIGLGVAVMILPLHSPYEVAHRIATLDYLSGGRAILGVGTGREPAYLDMQVSPEHRVSRFVESVEVIRDLWTTGQTTFDGRFYQMREIEMGPKPVQEPSPPIWFGGTHPNALRRAAKLADGWMGSGSGSLSRFETSVVELRRGLEEQGRDPSAFPISKRVFVAVDDEPTRAKDELDRFFGLVYRRSSLTESAGLWGRSSDILEHLEHLVDVGASHLLLNPVSRYEEQLEALGEMVGFT